MLDDRAYAHVHVAPKRRDPILLQKMCSIEEPMPIMACEAPLEVMVATLCQYLKNLLKLLETG